MESSPGHHTLNLLHGLSGHYFRCSPMYTDQCQSIANKATSIGLHLSMTIHTSQLSTSLQRNQMSSMPSANIRHGQRMSQASELASFGMIRVASISVIASTVS